MPSTAPSFVFARRLMIGVSIPAIATLIGCADVSLSSQASLAPEPPTSVSVSATQPVRDFDRTTAQYQNGDTLSDSATFRYQTSDTLHTALVPAAEVGVFVANVVSSPVTAYNQREGVQSAGFQFAPTHTAMPVLPPSQSQLAAAIPTAPSTQPSSMVISAPAAEPTIVATPAGLQPAAELSTTAFAVVGHVQFPGRYEAQPELRLSQAIVGAGLVQVDGRKVSVKIERAGEVPSSARLDEILSGNAADPTLLPGDILTVTVTP